MTLPPPTLHITAHNRATGHSVFTAPAPGIAVPFSPFGPRGSSFAVFDTQPRTGPVSADGFFEDSPPAESKQDIPRVPPTGAVFTTTDVAPGGQAPMHRTQSLDYAVVVSGEITLSLDSGEERVVRAGEFIVQRGTRHMWSNKGKETCRIAFVMLGSEVVTLEDGTKLEETVFASSG